ncbi:MAG: hypothetical protein Ct9H300mP5_5300 [Candidatus Pelagibacterales bacterium]|nr:MAG: hypothetical protein Ct9H300mP5_5300 [Pelagibacterales bacterium]
MFVLKINCIQQWDLNGACGSNQKNLYVEMNEVGINRISSRPHKIYSIQMELFGSDIKNH